MKQVSNLEVEKAIDLLRNLKGTVYLIGNGGSSAIASHFANDLNKPNHGMEGRHFKAICLADNTPLITAIANDVGYEYIFSEQVKNFMHPPDILVAISSSGMSPSIVKAIRVAQKRKIKVVAFTGFRGGRFKADAKIHVDSQDYGVIESIHQAIAHYIISMLK